MASDKNFQKELEAFDEKNLFYTKWLIVSFAPQIVPRAN